MKTDHGRNRRPNGEANVFTTTRRAGREPGSRPRGPQPSFPFHERNVDMRNSIRIVAALFSLAAVLGLPAIGRAAVKVTASIPDLASIAAAVGGSLVETSAIAKPNQDVHHIEVLPSYMVRVARADLYLKIGLGLDQWADQIIDGSRNAHLTVLDCSGRIDPLEKPTGPVTARMGDVHPNGNPHYWLDPSNGGVVAREVAEALSRLDPAHAAEFASRAEEFAGRCDALAAEGRRAAEALPVRRMVTYHASWIYLAHALGLEIAGTVEPVPGIPPTANHLSELVTLIRAQKIPLLLQEPYFSEDAGRFLNRETGLRVAKASPSCETSGPDSYLAHLRAVIALVTGANERGEGGTRS
jgi:zinc/manganese transport system substrate-binding protein